MCKSVQPNGKGDKEKMSDYERLTDKEHRYKYCANCKYRNCQYCDEEMYLDAKAYERLAELEDMIEQGLLIKLPCKIGDTIYTVEYSRYRDEWFIEEHKVLEFVICKNDIHFVDDYGYPVYIAFLTQAEAEAELAKKRGQK